MTLALGIPLCPSEDVLNLGIQQSLVVATTGYKRRLMASMSLGSKPEDRKALVNVL